MNYTPQSEYYRYVWSRMAREHPEFTHAHDLFDDPAPIAALLLGDYIGFTPFPGARVMDVGANVGILTAYWALNGCYVVAYEADHCTWRLLNEMLVATDLARNVIALNQAMWKCDGEIPFVGRSGSGVISNRNGAVQVPGVGDSAMDAPKVKCISFQHALYGHPWDAVKMDIEGSELEALWGARRILKEHSPVLAVCAYHTSDHLWQIPLLIHAIQPDYRLFLRRYAEGAFELVWYAVPPERVK